MRLGEAEILSLLEKYDYPFCKKMLDLKKKNEDDRFILQWYQFAFYALSHTVLHTRSQEVSRDDEILSSFASGERGGIRAKMIDALFNDDDNFLFEEKVFDRAVDESGKADKDRVCVHEDFKRKYLTGVLKQRRFDDLVEASAIVEEKLFYAPKLQTKIDDLTSMLMPDRFESIKERLRARDARTGFTCLFSGGPGTGKTSVVFQIARATGRDVSKVDMSSLRSKWWGEDEKNVKAVFTQYRDMIKNKAIEPILLFNEADAIIGKRMNLDGNNGAIVSSINTVQNIILEELENFEGILVATTNLTQNFDHAFQRRFLHQIEFDKPSREVRAKIWETKLGVAEGAALELADEFDLTGAQIDNVKRKLVAKSILYGDDFTTDEVRSMCREERRDQETTIGFASR